MEPAPYIVVVGNEKVVMLKSSLNVQVERRPADARRNFRAAVPTRAAAPEGPGALRAWTAFTCKTKVRAYR